MQREDTSDSDSLSPRAREIEFRDFSWKDYKVIDKSSDKCATVQEYKIENMNHVCTLYKSVTTPTEKGYSMHYEVIQQHPYIDSRHRQMYERKYEDVIRAQVPAQMELQQSR